MNKVLVLVEGPTEERFVKDVLVPYFIDRNIIIVPKILTSKEVKDGPNFKGGLRFYNVVKNDLSKLLGDSSANLVTTMFDYYGLPSNFPGYGDATGDCYQKVAMLEQSFREDISNEKLLPYLQLHEFEALLFSSPETVSKAFSGLGISDLESIVNEFNNPELINNNPQTCPSRRLISIYPNYNKVVFGSLISNRIGIETIMGSCQHFREWIETINSLSD